MFVRMMNPEEILSALHLIWEVYASEVAPLQETEAIQDFRERIRYESVMPRVQSREVVFFGAWEGAELCGTAGMDQQGNLLFLYVRKEWQRKGIGRRLMQEVSQFGCQVLRINRIRLQAVPSGVTALRHLGFFETAPAVQDPRGVFVPMELAIMPVSAPAKTGRKTALTILLVIGVGILIAVLAGMLVREAASLILKESSDTYVQELPYNEDASDDIGEYEETEQLGLDSIQAYEEDGISFEVKEEVYAETPESSSSVIRFEIYYPQLSGMKDEAVQEKVNQELKACAMETVDRIYDNPEDQVRDRVLEASQPVLADFVKYKVTYLTSDYICVAYEDYSYEGNEEYHYVGLRTRNINLKDGTVYEVKDIVKVDHDFVDEWLEAMREEAEDDTLLSDETSGELIKLLSGQDTENSTLLPVFFVDRDGIEIGLSFHYDKDEKEFLYGWVTAPFALKDLEKSQMESAFWSLVK